MTFMGQYFDNWYKIRIIWLPVHIAYCIGESLCFHPCVYLQRFTIPVPHKDNFSPWCIHFEIPLLRYIQNWVIGSFLIYIIAGASSCWLYDLPGLVLAVGQYMVMTLFLVLFLPCSRIHDQHPRFLNSWPVMISMHDTSSATMIDVPPLWNFPPEMVTKLYLVQVILVLNHPSVLLYIFSFMGILLQLLFTSASSMIVILSFIMLL